jgi:hypothetical protein
MFSGTLDHGKTFDVPLFHQVYDELVEKSQGPVGVPGVCHPIYTQPRQAVASIEAGHLSRFISSPTYKRAESDMKCCNPGRLSIATIQHTTEGDGVEFLDSSLTKDSRKLRNAAGIS